MLLASQLYYLKIYCVRALAQKAAFRQRMYPKLDLPSYVTSRAQVGFLIQEQNFWMLSDNKDFFALHFSLWFIRKRFFSIFPPNII